eukprot:8021392-Karenia_brevis.AAC.1
MPLILADTTRRWSGEISAVDASLSGYGVTALLSSSLIAGNIGRISERCRFRGELRTKSKPRSYVEGLLEEGNDFEVDDLTDAQIRVAATRTGFPEVPSIVTGSENWRVLAAKRWRHVATINKLEAE